MRPLPILPLATARLDLVEPAAGDANDIIRYVGDIDVAGKLSRVPHPYGTDDAAYFLGAVVRTSTVWVVRRRSDGQFLGVISLSPADGPGDAGGFGTRDDVNTELGYWLGKPFWGQGYATEAARAVVGFADDHGLTPLVSAYFGFNPDSGKVLRKVGFEPTGTTMRSSAAVSAERLLITMRRRRPAA